MYISPANGGIARGMENTAKAAKNKNAVQFRTDFQKWINMVNKSLQCHRIHAYLILICNVTFEENGHDNIQSLL